MSLCCWYWEEISHRTLAISSSHTACDSVVSTQLGRMPPSIRHEDFINPLSSNALLWCINGWASAHRFFWKRFLGSFFQSPLLIPRSSRYRSRATSSLHSAYGFQVVLPIFYCTRKEMLFPSHLWAMILSTTHSLSSALLKS